jgi:hypothetical protein
MRQNWAAPPSPKAWRKMRQGSKKSRRRFTASRTGSYRAGSVNRDTHGPTT